MNVELATVTSPTAPTSDTLSKVQSRERACARSSVLVACGVNARSSVPENGKFTGNGNIGNGFDYLFADFGVFYGYFIAFFCFYGATAAAAGFFGRRRKRSMGGG
jgi:hypothetical protein